MYLYKWIGNKFWQLTIPFSYKYFNNINQMTAHLQFILIIISKLNKIVL
jgi:hypothetical protein